MTTHIEQQKNTGEPELTSKQGLKMLIAELAIQKRHLKSVRDQNAALIACDGKRFTTLQELHTDLLGELEIQQKLRTALFGPMRVENIILTWPDADRRSAKRVMNDLLMVLSEIRRVNEQNRKLITNQMNYVEFMMKVLVNTHRKGSMYGPRGVQSVNRGNLFLNSAA